MEVGNRFLSWHLFPAELIIIADLRLLIFYTS